MEDTFARAELLKIFEITDKNTQAIAFCHFFQAIFVKVREQVKDMIKGRGYTRHNKPSYNELASLWRNYLEEGDAKHRRELFQAARDSHRKVMHHNSASESTHGLNN